MINKLVDIEGSDVDPSHGTTKSSRNEGGSEWMTIQEGGTREEQEVQELVRGPEQAELASRGVVQVSKITSGTSHVWVHVLRAGHTSRWVDGRVFDVRAGHFLSAEPWVSRRVEQMIRKNCVRERITYRYPSMPLRGTCMEKGDTSTSTIRVATVTRGCYFKPRQYQEHQQRVERKTHKIKTNENVEVNNNAATSAIGAIAATACPMVV